MTSLYSLNNQRPAPIPFRIHLPPPFPPTRTDPSTFTAEEIQAAGYTGPYTEPAYDPATQQLDWVDGTYVISPLPPPPPEPRWLEFSTTLMADPAVNVMLGAVLTAAPGVYGGLTVGLNEASKGDTRLFLSAWGAAQQQGLISTELAAAVQERASDHDLPADFVAALLPQRPAAEAIGQEWTDLTGQLWRVVQARDEDGQFSSDDPETPERESLAWQEVSNASAE